MTDRRMVLVGFMGCGKTSVAKELARRLDCDFVDLDTFITENHGRSPAEIIEQDGEPAFRTIETKALEDVLNRSELCVIALGGGTWTIETNRILLARQNCLSVWLDAPFDLCWRRIISNSDSVRPMAPDRGTAKTRYASRTSAYSVAETRIPIKESDTVETIVENILKLT